MIFQCKMYSRLILLWKVIFGIGISKVMIAKFNTGVTLKQGISFNMLPCVHVYWEELSGI